VDLDSIPPRATLVHPADGVSQEHDQSRRTSILWRPPPTINATVTGNSSDNVQTHGTTTTSAQRLYATGMTSNSSSNSSHFTSTSLPTARSIVDRDATPANTSPPPTQASPPLPPTSVSESEHFQPRYRPRRLLEKPQTTHPFSSLPLSESLTGQTLYNSAIQTSASLPTSDSFKPRGPRVTRNASLRSYAEGRRRKALPPIPTADGDKRNSLITISTTPHSQITSLYSGITEDNVFLIPAHGKVSSTEQRAILIDEVPLSPVSRSQSGLQRPSSQFTRSTDQVILQPRPIKPLQGLTASFQDQLRLTSQSRAESLEEGQLKNDASTAKQTPLVRRFTTTGLGRTIREDNCRPPRPSDEDSSWTHILDASLDESFVVVDDTHF
jgi:hypothetical protein